MSKVTVFRMNLVALSTASTNIAQAQFVPPAGYSGKGTQPGVSALSEPGAPALTHVPDTTLAGVIHVDPDYKRGATTGHVKIVGAFAIAETQKLHFVAAWSPSFLPITLSFSDGHCYSLQADYMGGTLSNGRLNKVSCDHRQAEEKTPSSTPPGKPLRFVGSAWGYDAWADDRARTTLVTAPYAETFKPLINMRMSVDAIMAMNGPDYPGGHVTVVGRVGGRLMVVTLEVGY